MKNKNLVIYVFATLMLMSCGGGNSTRTAKIDGISFDSIVTDTTVRLLDGEADSPACHLRLSIQYAKGDKLAGMINDSLIHSGILTPDYLALGKESMNMKHAIDSFLTRYISDYLKEYAPLYKQDRENSPSYSTEYLVNTKTQNGRDGIVNYLADVYSYGGGAHGSQQTIVKNINTSNGQVLTLQDVFVPGFEHGLNEKILEELCDKYDAKDLEELREQGILMGIDVYPTDNFILEKDDIVFIYVEDEIAPHAVGEIRVSLPYSDLDHILKK